MWSTLCNRNESEQKRYDEMRYEQFNMQITLTGDQLRLQHRKLETNKKNIMNRRNEKIDEHKQV